MDKSGRSKAEPLRPSGFSAGAGAAVGDRNDDDDDDGAPADVVVGSVVAVEAFPGFSDSENNRSLVPSTGGRLADWLTGSLACSTAR